MTSRSPASTSTRTINSATTHVKLTLLHDAVLIRPITTRTLCRATTHPKLVILYVIHLISPHYRTRILPGLTANPEMISFPHLPLTRSPFHTYPARGDHDFQGRPTPSSSYSFARDSTRVSSGATTDLNFAHLYSNPFIRPHYHTRIAHRATTDSKHPSLHDIPLFRPPSFGYTDQGDQISFARQPP